jgi:hypothetical protein
MDTAWNLACKALSIFADRTTLFIRLLVGLPVLPCAVIWACNWLVGPHGLHGLDRVDRVAATSR